MAEDNFNVTPWDVSGNVDYSRLVKEFGIEEISEDLLKRFEKISGKNFMLDRKIFFAHRDLKWLLDEILPLYWKKPIWALSFRALNGLAIY